MHFLYSRGRHVSLTRVFIRIRNRNYIIIFRRSVLLSPYPIFMIVKCQLRTVTKKLLLSNFFWTSSKQFFLRSLFLRLSLQIFYFKALDLFQGFYKKKKKKKKFFLLPFFYFQKNDVFFIIYSKGKYINVIFNHIDTSFS